MAQPFKFNGYPNDPWKPAAQTITNEIPVMPAVERVEYVMFSVEDAKMHCGLDAIKGFSLYMDIPGKEYGGDPDEYNRRRLLKVRKEGWLDKIEETLIGKPGLLIFSRMADVFGKLVDEFDQPELLKMVESDPRCTLLASYLNRTGPHAERPNHLKLFMFHGKHKNPDTE